MLPPAMLTTGQNTVSLDCMQIFKFLPQTNKIEVDGKSSGRRAATGCTVDLLYDYYRLYSTFRKESKIQKSLSLCLVVDLSGCSLQQSFTKVSFSFI